MSLSCAVCDMHAAPLQREMSRQTASEIVSPSHVPWLRVVIAQRGQRPTQFLIFLFQFFVTM